MRVHPSKRAFLRRYPAPAPTPDGMVYDPFDGPNGQLVTAESVQRRAIERMGRHDEMWAERRKQLQGR
jgi:hypothetical protein